MKDLAKLQDKIEERASTLLLHEISKLEKEYRDLVNRYIHITGGVTIKMQDKDGRLSTPYLSQFFISEAVIERIKEHCLPNYVNSVITKILEK